MNGEKPDDLYFDAGYRIRSMENLINQIREDHSNLTQLWDRFEKGTVDPMGIEEIVRVLSWIKQELKLFNELRKKKIEGVFWGGIKNIEMEIKDKESDLKMILFSISKEIEYYNLR